MQCNINKKNKVIRLTIALCSFILGVMFQSWWGLLGFVPLYTITIAWCPKAMFCAMESNKWWHQCCKGCC